MFLKHRWQIFSEHLRSDSTFEIMYTWLRNQMVLWLHGVESVDRLQLFCQSVLESVFTEFDKQFLTSRRYWLGCLIIRTAEKQQIACLYNFGPSISQRI